MNQLLQRDWLRFLILGFFFSGLVVNPGVANPLGEAVRSGEVQFERTDGGLRILQGSDRAIIDWESFSISANEFTEFVQPSERSAALNRVRGVTASQIDGALRANGNVLLINPNGIIIGPSGTIDVNGFIASTLDISDGEFLAGGDLNFRGESQQGIVNLGRISATGGDIFLIAATVENSGTIEAPNGTVGLAAGNDVLLKASDDGSGERIFVRGASGGKKANGVVNKGTIDANIAELKAHGGNVYALAVKNEGRVAATGVTKTGGQIFLSAGGNGTKIRNEGTLKATRQNGDGGRIEINAGPGGTVENAGEIDASSEAGQGGQIFIIGSQIVLERGSLVIADGATGGGEIFIGGGQRGEDGELMNAENVTVEAGTTISANATNSGDGGRVILFAENRLDFQGDVSAMGGPIGGNGGFVELSGKNSVNFRSLFDQVKVGAPGSGMGGSLLFDPNDILIRHGNSEGEGAIESSPTMENEILDQDIINFLESPEGGNLTIQTDSIGEGNGDISFEDDADITWNSSNSLTFNAIRNFNLNSARIESLSSGGIAVEAGGEFKIGNSGLIGGPTMTGDISITAASVDLDAGARLQSAGNLTIAPFNPSSDINIGAGAIDSGLQLDAAEIGTFANGFNSITIGDLDSTTGSGRIRVSEVTFFDPTTLAAPDTGGEIFVDGQISGADNASITLDGAGPASSGAEAATTYLSADIITSGNAITINDDVILRAGATLDTTGGGFLTGADITIAGTIDSEDGGEGEAIARPFTANAGTGGGIIFQGDIGSSSKVGDVDLDAGYVHLANSLISDGSLTIDVRENFSLDAPGSIVANGDATINANRGTIPDSEGFPEGQIEGGISLELNPVDFHGIEINSGITSENGSINLSGTSGTGDAADNIGVWLRGGSGLNAFGSIEIKGHSQAIDGIAVRVDAPVFSEADVQITAERGAVEINRIVGAEAGLGLFGSAFEDTDFRVTASIPLTALTVDGGSGLNTLDFTGFSEGPLELGVDQLTNIQTLTGGENTEDLLTGSMETGGTFLFGGEYPVEYTDTSGKKIGVTNFENITGSPFDDTFIFASDALGGEAGFLLPGDLDGGGAIGGDTLDFSNLAEVPVDINFIEPGFGFASGIDGRISNIKKFIGSPDATNSFTGPQSGATFQITGLDEFSVTELFEATGFQNLIGGSGDNTFEFLSGGSLSGSLEGASEGEVSPLNTLSFANFGSAITIDLENQTADAIGNGFSNIQNFVGSGETGDQINLTSGNDIIEVDADDSGLVNESVTFESIENINSGEGSDLFNFNGLFTFSEFINGGANNDTLNIFTDPLREIPGPDPARSVFIQEGRITIIPVWNFGNFENIGLTTGGGNDTVTTQFNSFRQTLRGGRGIDTLNFSQAPFGSRSPVFRGGAGPVNFSQFEILRFAPNPDTGEIFSPVPPDQSPDLPDITLGDLLQLQLDNVGQDPNGLGEQGDVTFGAAIGGLGSEIGLGALQNALGAFGAIAQQGIVFGGLDSSGAIAVIPFSLDGSGVQPSNLGIQLLQQALAPDANTELLAALGLDLGIFLVNPDGPFAIDLSGPPALPATIQELLANISPLAQSELQNAIGVTIVVLLLPVDGAFAIDSSAAQPTPAAILIFNELLSPAAQEELNAALGIQ